jgi:hypothetical protein
MDAILFNPICMLFLSFMFGAFAHSAFAKTTWYKKYFHLNFIDDQTTKSIGVLWIEWLILNSPLRIFNTALKIEGRPSKTDLIKLREVMTAAELSHLIGFVFILPIVFYYILIGKSALLIISMTILNILFNVYTALTQQYNKRRLDKLLSRMK